MTQNERVKEIRQTLNLTLEKFGEPIGLKKSALSLIENGMNSLTDANIKAICREFGVDYIWLTTGDGEMFIDTDDEFMEKIDQVMADENELRKNMIKTLLYAPDDDIEALSRMIDYYISLRDVSKKD